MSNCRANSASVLSPLTAARATFALKAGEWFRRGRLVIVSPGLQLSWLLSGRNSTYPAVQTFKASSNLASAVVSDRHNGAESRRFRTRQPPKPLFLPFRGDGH